jgi:hypothetical protein
MQRSVAGYAAELKAAEGIELWLRVGINSGEVIVGDIATAGRFTYTAIGHTVGLAQRMEALAAPGSVYLTGHAARLAQGYLALRDLGPHQVKGSSRPVPVFELVGLGTARGHIDVARRRGLTRFVGREAELRELDDALTRAQAGDGQVVGVIADPGLGKSRLVSEFVQDLHRRGIEVHEAHCQAHARMLPLVPVLEMLRSYFGITEDLGPAVARARVEARVLEADARLAGELPLIFEFLAIPDPQRPLGATDPEARRRRLLELIRRLVRAPSRTRVVVTSSRTPTGLTRPATSSSPAWSRRPGGAQPGGGDLPPGVRGRLYVLRLVSPAAALAAGAGRGDRVAGRATRFAPLAGRARRADRLPDRR